MRRRSLAESAVRHDPARFEIEGETPRFLVGGMAVADLRYRFPQLVAAPGSLE